MSRKDSDYPLSWSVNNWPPTVWPNSPHKARYVMRANRDSLILAGALSRVGRELIIIGAKYSRWLEKNSVNVPDFQIAPNASTSSIRA
jgi:hypothetical protein